MVAAGAVALIVVSGEPLLVFSLTSVAFAAALATTPGELAEWFEAACRHLEDQQLNEAVEAFRLCLIDDPHRADANFQLAEGAVEGASRRPGGRMTGLTAQNTTRGRRYAPSTPPA